MGGGTGLGEDGCCGLHCGSCAESPAVAHHTDRLWPQKLLEKGAFIEAVHHQRVLVERGVHFIYKCVIWASPCVFGRAES